MRRVLVRIAAAVLLVTALTGLGLWLTVRSHWFQDKVRQRIVFELDRATGGKAELGGYTFDWRTMRVEVRGLVIHGLEPAGSSPLFQAERVAVGLKLVSVVRRKVDLLSLHVTRPALTLLVDKQGRTNIPEPQVKRQSQKAGLEQFVDLAVGEYSVERGEFAYNDRRIPLQVAGRDLVLKLSYEVGARAYQGELKAAAVNIAEPIKTGAGVRVDALWRLTEDALHIQRAELEFEGGKGVVDARVTPLTGEARVDGHASMEATVAGILKMTPLPVAPEGRARVTGTFSRDASRKWRAAGTLSAQGARYAEGGVDITGIALDSNWHTDFAEVQLDGLRLRALDGEFRGEAQVSPAGGLHAKGRVEGVSLSRLLAARQITAEGYSGKVSGEVEAWTKDKQVRADLTVNGEQAAGNLAGHVSIRYDGLAGQIAFGPSHLELTNSRVHFGGDPGKSIQVGLTSSNLDDFLPLLRAGGAGEWKEMPLRLDKGQLRFDGTVSGALAEPVIAGRIEAGPLLASGQRVEKLAGRIEVSKDRLRISGLEVSANGSRVAGEVSASLTEWKLAEASLITGHLDAAGADLENLLRHAKQSFKAQGKVDAAIDIEGTYGSPRVSARVKVYKPVIWDETFDAMEADVRYSSTRVEVSSGKITEGPAVIRFSGAMERGEEIQFQIEAANWMLRQWGVVERQPAKLDGAMMLRVNGSARLVGPRLQLTGLTGKASIEQLTVNKRAAGKVEISSETRGRTMSVRFDVHLPNSEIIGTAEWDLGGNSFGLGQIRIPRLTFADLKELGFLGEPEKELAFRGEVQGEIGFSGPVLQPDRWTGVAKITRLEVEPVRGLPGTQRVDPSRLLLRNRETLIAQVDTSAITLQAVHLVAEGTDLEVLGTIGLKTRNPWNLHIKGSLNLPSLSTFEPDLVATGVSLIDATVRGSYERPQLMGRMELRNASFRLRDVPNGLARANGVIVFDRTRANIENFTAQTGGGELRVTGFVGLAGPELLYRLQASLQQVRVRYPDQVSTTFNGALSLTGTATQSVLSGTATITRVSMNPQADMGSLLQQSSRNRSAPPQSGFLRGMQLDLKIETSPDAELQTSLTRDLQPEAELRVRGSFIKPVLLGRISVNQGEINFFGNRYAITRGEVSFFNTAKVEPVLDLDLETRVRGITVTINFTGPMDKLAVSYRSDPPLQSSEIVALLTVGRAPGTAVSPNMPSSRNQGYLSSGGDSLLGQAISAPVTGRLERLFGVSRIKIDPDLTGVTNTAQTRLTVEQQLSRDITITYITNLNRTQQQIVRLQWDFSKDFSLLAVRDENGIFGVDFLWRRRFK